jgi:ABC-2 type transport system ATP-binding protein
VDAVSRTEFWEMLKRLIGYGITILVSTPYMDEASRCDRVALIQNGNILKINSPAEIVKSYGKKIFSVCSERAFSLLTDLRQLAGDAYAFGNEIHFSMESMDVSHVIQKLNSLGHENILVREISPNIEDCFMELMSKQ